MKNFCEYYYLHVIVSINSLSTLNVIVNTILKYYHNQALSKKIKLMGETIKFLWKKLLGHEIFNSAVPWAKKFS